MKLERKLNFAFIKSDKLLLLFILIIYKERVVFMDKKTICRKIILILCTLCLVLTAGTVPARAAAPSVEYSVHVQDKGWLNYTSDGNITGTVGEALRMEAMKIRLKNASGTIWYKAHVQDVGWQDWVSNDTVAGTEGKLKQMEAIKIQLAGNISRTHDVFYRVHVGDIGWLGWTKNGSIAGTTDLGLRIEAVQIVLKKKNEPEKMSTSYLTKPSLRVNSHVQDIGWMGYVGEGQTSGTEGKSLRMEALNIICSDLLADSGVTYRAHIQDIGWQKWVSSGRTVGTTGQSKAIEAVQIQLTGSLSKACDVYYRAHVKDIGWMGWAKNGEAAGTTGGGRPMEAIQVKLVLKGDSIDRGGSAYRELTAQKTKLSYGLYKKNSAYISCGFDGYKTTSGRHEGIDIQGGNGSSIYSLTDGEVVRVTYGKRGRKGLSTIAIYDSNANKTVVYLHSSPATLKVGQKITRGQYIGKQDWRGVSTSSGGHTHVEVVNGKAKSAKKSVGDKKLDNSDPTSYWNSKGYTIQ